MKYLILWLRVFYGAHLTYSGMRYYIAYAPRALLATFHYKPFAPAMPPLARAFVDALTATGIYHVVKTVELIVGIALLANLFVPLVLIIEMPISVVIFILNFFVVASDRQLFSGPQEILLNGLLILFYSRYYRPLLQPVVPPLPLWASSSRTLGGEPDAGSAPNSAPPGGTSEPGTSLEAMHLNKIFDLGYDLVPTLTASVVVLIAVLRDARRKRRG